MEVVLIGVAGYLAIVAVAAAVVLVALRLGGGPSHLPPDRVRYRAGRH